MSQNITFGNVAGNVTGNTIANTISGSAITLPPVLERALRDVDQQDELRQMLGQLNALMELALERDARPDELTVRELFRSIRNASKTVFNAAWAFWKSPLDAMGLLLKERDL